MSLNDLLALLSSFLNHIPFRFFDYILMLSFVGYAIAEGSYNLGVVMKRSLSLMGCAFLALFLYRFLSGSLQDLVYISKGISDGISLLGVWIMCLGIGSLISHFVVKEKLSSFTLSQKVKIPLAVVASFGGFTALIWVIIHVFIAMPLPTQAKTFLTSSVIVQKILIVTFESDLLIQKIYTEDPSTALHVLVVNELDQERELRTKGLGFVESGNPELIDQINEYRLEIGRGPLIGEEILSSAAGDLAQKYAQQGIVKDQPSELAGVLSERGILFSKMHTVTVLTDSNSLLPHVLISNQVTNAFMRDHTIAKMGSARMQLGGGTTMTVVIVSD